MEIYSCHNIFLDVQPTDEENGYQSRLESKCTMHLLNGVLYFNDPGAILNLYVTILRSVHFYSRPVYTVQFWPVPTSQRYGNISCN